MTGIYIITNLINGKSYIGQSRNIERRFSEHKNPKREGNQLLRKDLSRYGKDNFKYAILEECDASSLDEREGYYIRLYKPEYNVKGHTEHGIHYIDNPIRNKIKETNKVWWNNLPPETREKIINKNLTGKKEHRHLTEEQKEHLRQVMIGKKQSSETVEKRKETIRRLKETGAYIQDNSGHRKPIVCTTDGNKFESVKSAGEWYGISPSSVSSVLKGRQRKTNGLVFEYLEV